MSTHTERERQGHRGSGAVRHVPFRHMNQSHADRSISCDATCCCYPSSLIHVTVIESELILINGEAGSVRRVKIACRAAATLSVCNVHSVYCRRGASAPIYSTLL